MTSAFDPRIVKATIEFEDDRITFDGLYIRATGEKFISAQFNTCECTIYNMTEAQRNYILRKTSPLRLNRTSIRMTLEVGRNSYGTFVLFDGNIWKSTTTQPPDIGITLEAYTGSYNATQTNSVTYTQLTKLSQLAQAIATNLGLTLVNQATDKTVGNVSHSGSAAAQVQQLNNVGGIVAFVDNTSLVVLDVNKSIIGAPRLINSTTGMIGLPILTEYGVQVGLMLDNTIDLGKDVTIESKINPVANGSYFIQQLKYDVANREQPFWYSLSCKSKLLYAGSVT